jgi:hypothetical protein
MVKHFLSGVCLSLFLITTALGQNSASILLRNNPKQILIEKTRSGQELNFDFLLENKTDANWEMTRVSISVFDKAGKLVLQKSAWSGLAATLPDSFIIEAKKTKLLLNPFYTFPAEIELGKLKYEFFFSESVEDGKSFSAEAIISPILYQPKTNLMMPLRGRVLVYEGHDFYAHHRRVDLTNPVVAQLGVTTNPTRYGYDFSVANESNAIFRNGGKTNEDWFGFGTPILAPADGVIKEARNTVDDNVLGHKMFDFRLVFQDIKAFYGNYLVIDHQNGEFSLLLHLKKGSLAVKAGERVKQGQKVAEMGISGDSEYVHLHYQLQNALELNNETLPAYFSRFRWWHGNTFTVVKNGTMETGDIVEAILAR